MVGKMKNTPARKRKKSAGSCGFTLLELVISIFLIAVVLGTILLLLSANLNVIERANEMMIANALAQYSLEEVKNIEFPPVYTDRQSDYGDRPESGGNYMPPESVDPANDGQERTPGGEAGSFMVKRYDFRYDAGGNFLDGSTSDETEKTAYHLVDIYVLKKNDRSVLLKNSVMISRDGLQ